MEDRNHNGILDFGESNPLSLDSDGDGIPDGVEDANHDGIVDDGETSAILADSDGDGMPDGIDPSPRTAAPSEAGLSVSGGGAFGCASTTPAGSASFGGLVILALGALGLVRRRRRDGVRDAKGPNGANGAHGLALVALVTAATATIGATAARAAETGDFAVERFQPALDRDGIINAESASVGAHLDVDLTLTTMFELNPLAVYSATSTGEVRKASLVAQRIGGDVAGAVGILDWVQLGVDLPYVALQARDDHALAALIVEPQSSLAFAGVGDIRIAPKVRVLREAEQGVDLAVIPAFTLPSASPLGSYLGDGAPTFQPAIAVGRSFGAFRALLDVGAHLRPTRTFLDTRIGSDVDVTAGGAWRNEALELALSTSTAVGILGTQASAPLEVNAQAAYDLGAEWQIFGGAGAGVLRGLGTPDARVVAGVRFSPRVPAPAPAPAPAPPPPSDCRDAVAAALAAAAAPPPVAEAAVEAPPVEAPVEAPVVVEPAPAPAPAPVEPEPEPASAPPVTLEADRVKLGEQIHFAHAQDVIDDSSHALLDKVAALLVAHPEVKRVRVEGHTDDRGVPAYNQDLSERRAAAVVAYLVAHGVDASRLSSAGFGSQQPIASNDTPEGREQNRRVELRLAEQ